MFFNFAPSAVNYGGYLFCGVRKIGLAHIFLYKKELVTKGKNLKYLNLGQ